MAEQPPPVTSLLEANSLLEIMFERTPVGIAVFDRDLVLQRCNPTWASFVTAYAPLPAGPVAVSGARFFDLAPGNEDTLIPLIERVLCGEVVRREGLPLAVGGRESYWDLALVPLTHDGRVIGILDVSVDATARVEAGRQIERQNAYLAALHEMGLGIIGRLDVNELLQAIVERAQALVVSLYGWVYLVKPGGGAIEVKVGTGMFERYVGLCLQRGEGLAGAIWQHGQPMTLDDYHTWSSRAHHFDGDPIGPAMGVPLKNGGAEVVGVIGLTRPPGQPPFVAAELELMGRFAQLASIALENARLHASVQQQLLESQREAARRAQAEEALQAAYQTLERRVEERTHALATLNAIACTVSRSLDLDAILSDALDKTLEILGAQAGAAYRLEDPSQSLLLVSHRGLPDRVLQISNRNPVVMALGGKPLTQAAPVVWDVGTDYPPGMLKESMQAAGLSTVIGIPLVAKEKLVGCLSLSTSSPRTLSAEETALLMAVGQQVGVATENARLYKGEYERHEEAERRQRVAEGMREILAVLNSRQSLPEALNSIVSQACRLLGCDAAVLFRLGPDQLLRVQASHGLDEEYTARLSLPFGRGGAGRALAEHRAVPLPDVASYQAYLAHECPVPNPESASLDQLLQRRINALLSVPLVVRDKDYGAITLYYRARRDFSEEDMRLALSVAHQAALAIESARLREQAQAAAALAERSRLARELHDSVTQSIYSVTLYAEAAARLLNAGDHAQAAQYLRDLRDTSQEALREMRLLVFELRPPALEQVGLAGALEARLKAVEARGGMTTEFRIQGAGPAPWLSLHDQQELYTIAQEALNNAFKHARAGHISIALDYCRKAARLTIHDDGAGFDPIAARACGGMGLTGMAERAERIGARLVIESRPGGGTTVTVEVPQDRPGAGGAGADE